VHLTLFDRPVIPRQPVDRSNPIPKEKLRGFVGCPASVPVRWPASVLGCCLDLWLLLRWRYEGDLDLRPGSDADNHVLGHRELLDL